MNQPNIQLNNARQILGKYKKENSNELPEKHLAMIECGEYSEVTITDENIHNNSKFILELWD